MPTDADKQLLQPSPSANREGKKMYTKTLESVQSGKFTRNFTVCQ